MRLGGRGTDLLSTFLGLFARMFGGRRDMAAVLGYQPVLTYEMYLARWARGDIAGRIIDIPAEATWDTLPRLTEDKELHSATALSDKFERLVERLELRRKIEKADKLAGIGRYATMLVGFNDGKKLEEPVKEGSVGPDDVLFVQPFSEANAIPADIDVDPSSPNFGSPSHFHIDLARGLTEADPSLHTLFSRLGRSYRTMPKVHVSRLVHVAEGTLEDDIYGMPRLRRVWDRLDDLAKIAGGSAEVFWMVANRGIQFNLQKDMELSPEDEAKLEKQVEEYDRGLRRWIQTRGVDIKGLNELGAGNVNPRQVFSVIAALIGGSSDIPYRMIFGTERGQNINAQDQNEWNAKVGKRRRGFANEVVLRPFIRKVVFAGALPSLALKADLFWPPTHDDMHQAEVADTIARANFNQAKAVTTGNSPMGNGEFRGTFLNLPPNMPEEKPPVLPTKDVGAPGDGGAANGTPNGHADPEGMNGHAPQ